MKYSQAVVMQFAKAPIAGQVKTRLHDTLGVDGATALHRALVTHSYEKLCCGNVCHLQLWGTDDNDDFFRQLTEHSPVTIHQQKGTDLGEKMAFAIGDALANFSFGLVIGSDCPAIDESYIEQAINHLSSGCDVVIGPANDGGYGLVGASRRCPELFQGIDWGTAQVLAQTRNRLEALGWRWAELSPIVDIDEATDLVELAKYSNLAHFQLTS